MPELASDRDITGRIDLLLSNPPQSHHGFRWPRVIGPPHERIEDRIFGDPDCYNAPSVERREIDTAVQDDHDSYHKNEGGQLEQPVFSEDSG
jgi:hypothetical protein